MSEIEKYSRSAAMTAPFASAVVPNFFLRTYVSIMARIASRCRRVHLRSYRDRGSCAGSLQALGAVAFVRVKQMQTSAPFLGLQAVSNKPLVPTRKGEAPLLAVQRRRLGLTGEQSWLIYQLTTN